MTTTARLHNGTLLLRHGAYSWFCGVAFVAFSLLYGSLLVMEPDMERGRFVIILAFAVLYLAGAVWQLASCARCWVIADEHGVVVQPLLGGTRRIRWGEVRDVRVEHGRSQDRRLILTDAGGAGVVVNASMYGYEQLKLEIKVRVPVQWRRDVPD